MKKETVVSLFLLAALTPAAEARNPFAFGADQETRGETPSGPRLTLILITGVRRRALIDGVEVTVGERTPYGTVTRIDRESVLLSGDDGSTRLLRVGEERR